MPARYDHAAKADVAVFHPAAGATSSSSASFSYDTAALAVGAGHVVAARTDDTLAASGYNVNGQLGNNSTTDAHVPVAVSGYTRGTPVFNRGVGPRTTDAYDGDGLRSSKTVAGTTTPFTWDPSAGLPTLVDDGTNFYIYGPGGLPLEHIDRANTVTWYHHDQLGSTRALTSATGATVATATYDPYGNLTASTGKLSPLGFAGEYTDAETGFQYLRARYYDPATGQFLSRDPLVALTGSAYGYVGENPLNGTDHSGMSSCGQLSLGGLVDCTAKTGRGLGYIGRAIVDGNVCTKLSGPSCISAAEKYPDSVVLPSIVAVVAGVAASCPNGNPETEEGPLADAGLPFHDAAREQRVTQTLDDIQAGATRYFQDGTVFQNRDALLPKQGPGYYSEYTVENPPPRNRGVERIVVGASGEAYHTPDHYRSLVRIR